MKIEAGSVPVHDLDRTCAAMRVHSWVLVLLGARQKRPVHKPWPTTQDPEVVERHVHGGENVGLLCGPASGVAVLDCDDPAAWEELSDTLGRLNPWVRTGSGKYHYPIVFEPDLPAKVVWRGAIIGELQRGDGNQQLVVLPPSIHPNGQPYTWLVEPHAQTLAPLPGLWRAFLKGWRFGHGRA
jgi:hypothetical protein